MHNFFFEKYFFINNFEPNLIKCQDKKTSIIYRNYKKDINYNEIIEIKNFCKENNFKFYLSNNVKLAINLDLDGAYIPSFNNKFHHLSYSYKKNFVLLGSAHNHKEIQIKKKQKVERIFLSSLFKNNKNYLGINKFQNYTLNEKQKFIALGGVNNKNLKKISLLNVLGFAGISFFKKKAPKKGP